MERILSKVSVRQSALHMYVYACIFTLVFTSIRFNLRKSYFQFSKMRILILLLLQKIYLEKDRMRKQYILDK